MITPQWKDYKLNSWVLHREERIIYHIVTRNHKERKVELMPYKSGKIRPIGKWRTVKELRRWFILLDKSVMETLYGTKTE